MATGPDFKRDQRPVQREPSAWWATSPRYGGVSSGNPTDPNNIIGVYQQDRWSNGGAHGLVAAVSHDGGQTWPVHSWAHFSKCSGGIVANGGDIDRASDPWVTFSPDGDAYFMSLSASADLTTSATLVAKSTNGGDTWSEPTTLIRETSDFHFNDKNSITADPTDSNFVYAVWDRSEFPSENADFNVLHSIAFRGDIYFARTTDGGQTWEPARAIFAPKANLFTIGNQIAVQPNGTLVDIFALSKGSGVQSSLNPVPRGRHRLHRQGRALVPADQHLDGSVGRCPGSGHRAERPRGRGTARHRG